MVEMESTSATIPVGYKQTEVGVIPEDWMVGNLDRFIQAIDCKHITPKFVQLGIPLASIGEVKGRFIDLSNANHTTSEFYNILTGGGRKPIVGDLILSRNATVGEVSQVATGSPIFAMGQDVVLLRKRSDDFSSSLIQEVLESFIVRLQLENCMVGSTFRRVNVKQIKELIIPLPNTASEQNMISKVLTDTNIFIEQLEEYIDKKRDIKKGIMQELLTRKTRLPGFSGEWEDFVVGDVIEKFFCGPSPTCEERNIQGDVEWGVLKTTAITWENGWSWKKHKTLPEKFWNQPDKQVQYGDVLVTKAGPRNRVGVVTWVDFIPERILASGKMIGLRPRKSIVHPLMLAAAISSKEAQQFLNQRASGMAEAQVNFKNSDLLDTPILLPQYGEQMAIAEVLSDMGTEIVILEKRLEKAKAIKKGMMQQLLTGRIRLVDSSTPQEARV